MYSVTYGPLSPIQTDAPLLETALMAGVIPRAWQRLVERSWRAGIAAAELRATLAAIARAAEKRMLIVVVCFGLNG